ncbi:right-handed parallel beta-helix repeat-containing protein [Paenibacillus elgii]|nr:right-handed parallel beta-helix repeat-containing protein [Paenibacillus elgii]
MIRIRNQAPRVIAAAAILFGMLVANVGTPQAEANPVTYYVSTSGSDSNPGTSSSAPWKTLQYAADHAAPGSTVYVLGGVYNQKLKITKSGSAAAGPITFESSPAQAAIIDGTDLSVSGSEGLVDIADASYVTLKGFEIRNYATSAKGKMPVGIFVHGAGSHIELRNNNVHHIKNTATLGSDLAGRDAHGIAVYGTKAPAALERVVIDGNTLSDLVLGSSESLVVNGNVDSFEITNNLIHDNDNIGIDVIGFEGKAPNPAYDQARNGLIRGNTVYNITSNNNPSYGKKLPNDSNAAGGIYVDGGKDTVIEQNYSYNNDIGIEIASEHQGKSTSGVTIRNNLVYGNRYTGIAMGGYDTKRGSTVNCIVVNNTLYKNDTKNLGGGQLLLQYDTQNNIVKNNIMVAGASNILIYNEYTKNSGNVVDYNLYFAPGGNSNATWTWKNKEYTGFAAYKSGTGNDAHSKFADPGFVNASANNFHLKVTSPAINAGSTEPAIIGAADLDGQPRVQGSGVDIGAYEATP